MKINTDPVPIRKILKEIKDKEKNRIKENKLKEKILKQINKQK